MGADRERKETMNGIIRRFFTRCLDFTGALCALVFLSPLLAAVALAILIDDGAPVLFRQTRVGHNGVPFLILKFRTMRDGGGPRVTAAGDQRITRVGRWLRRFKLDELPQFVNVLRGEMGLIGPRPEVPEYVQFDTPLWQEVLSMKPGITDLASLAFRNEEDMLSTVENPEAYYRLSVLPVKLRLNVQYQRARSLGRDARLLWLTARYSFFPSGFEPDQVVRALDISHQRAS
jgi:lipopolysaccharide/colanic/teichoic acid biosynthesis glycosyltransferase